MEENVPGLLDMPVSVYLIILSLAGPEEGARLASCCHALHAPPPPAASSGRACWTAARRSIIGTCRQVPCVH